jgi:hypothetical protein
LAVATKRKFGKDEAASGEEERAFAEFWQDA